MNKMVRQYQKAMTTRLSSVSVLKGLVLGVSLGLVSFSAHAEEHLSATDRQVPSFALPVVDDGELSTASLEGKLWVVNFWATWCPPCVEEIPSMNEAWAVLEPQGIGMLAINAGEGQEAVLNFLKKVPIDFPTLLGDANTLANWSVRALPTTLVINAQGKVIYEALGPREWNDEALLQRIIALQ